MSEPKQSETPLKTAQQYVDDGHLKDHCDYADIQQVIDDCTAHFSRENQRLREHPMDCAVIDDILFELQKRKYEVTGIDGDTSPADILVSWFDQQIKQANEERDQWKACCAQLSDAAIMAAGYISTRDGLSQTLETLKAAIAEFDKLTDGADKNV